MEIGSDGVDQITSGGNGKKKIDNSNDGLSKPKRQMKTPFQLETLEKVYAVEPYPSEATRAEMSEKLGLSDRQLQMWFCHRRLKDKKDVPSKKQRKPAAVQPPVNELPVRSVPEPESGSGSGYSPYSNSGKNFASGSSSSRAGSGDYGPIGRRNHEARISVVERRAIACVEAQLGEPLREDGPILGMEFDPLPPDAFGTPIEMQKRSVHPYESKMYEPQDARSCRSQAASHSIHEQPSKDDPSSFIPEVYGRYSEIRAHGMEYDNTLARSSSFLQGNGHLPTSRGIHGNVARNRSTSRQTVRSPFISSVIDDENVMLEKYPFDLEREDPYSDVHRKGKVDEVRLARESEARDSCARKEIQRRKNEEHMSKEIERHERERRKEEERLIRERLREEERSQREQKREMERRAKFLQKELERVEKKRQKEELRREKESMRHKIAIEKATARRIAKESMDLIEDEQLELMELAAASNGLPSILQLDHDTLENLELFRDSLSSFPPKSVQLKRPFSISPWKDSEENVGNLLMVWRFLIAFADVLGLWPFTLGEFIQAFHDYDSRLLGEIHVALLSSIIRDIEDVARTPFTGSGIIQYTVANPEGGHPQLVEGAYAWGFDIHSWQKRLSPLTWPEILRQLALSAGFGPWLKKKGSWLSFLGDKDEVKACEDIISTIRSGSAAENAFALMREKGLLLPRKSRHRLTPGTVKFAAFHILSLEGSKGLTVLELAEKIQESGLRDLTTSKTPEASISVALTRDIKLFERIAPSTYCVRAPYRKDPVDAEAILIEARKKIRAFENGSTGVEDVERDEGSEGVADEDPEVDDISVTPANASKNADDLGEENVLSANGKDDMICGVKADIKNGIKKDLSCLPSSSVKNDVVQTCLDNKNVEVEINQAHSWIQGLTEGDYCHLSVEERLDALVALIGIANEGNSIRAVLEERMEAANSLKKQMWAEAQLDKNCMRDIMKLDFEYSKTEPRMPQHIIQIPANERNNINIEPTQSTDEQKPLEMVSNDRTFVTQNTDMGHDNFASQHGYASKRSRSQLKSYIGQRSEEIYVYRSLPLGQDRRHNRYWQFAASSSRNDPCSGLIFVELHDGKWRLIDTEEAFEALVTSLDMRGIRESHLRIMLLKIEGSFKENVHYNFQLARNHCLKEKGVENEAAEMNSSPDSSADFDSPSSALLCGSNSDSVETSNSFRVELGRNDTEKKNLLQRYQDFQGWMWSESFKSLLPFARKHGKKRCDQLLEHGAERMLWDSTGTGLVESPLPVGVSLLKALLVFLEASIPDEALESFWTEEEREKWVLELNASSSPEDLIQVVTLLENAIKEEYLSSDIVTAKELLGAASGDQGSVSVLPWIPQTVSAVALRISELDASIQYIKHEKPDITLADEDEEIRLPSGNSPFKSKTIKFLDDRDEAMREEVFMGKRNSKRGRANCDPGSSRKVKRKKRRVGPNRSTIVGRNAESMPLRLAQEGAEINSHQTGGRGRRTVRRRPERRIIDDRVADIVMPRNEEEEEEEEATQREMEEEWVIKEDENAHHPVDYSRRDWGSDGNSNPNEASVEEKERDEEYEGIGPSAMALEEEEEEAETSESSDENGVPNKTWEEFGIESEDYSSDS
ncbi:PREDICTED: homeobox-DDT domain protein RLT1-like [Tarenaya hassleriana]|uniref:homeobox-DDT domain protein RLT1-like n=1 Tax=Tarenaya hassleriana TaxID=28532 RepID=UPI00053C2E7D|nr:PREDICTED: homeobox-DDT domain protein RLT1-like [Tarenaya hassleriana]